MLTGPVATPVALIHRSLAVRTGKWLEPSHVLLAIIPISSPSDFKVVWTEVPDREEVGLQRARELASAL